MLDNLLNRFKFNPVTHEDEPLEPVDPAAIPTGTIEWKTGEITAADPDLAALLARGANLKAKQDALKDELDTIRTEILSLIDPGVTVRIDGIATVIIFERETATVISPTMLQQILGSRFEDLVRIEMKHYPTPKLLELTRDQDNPLAPLILNTMKVDRTTVISYRVPK